MKRPRDWSLVLLLGLVLAMPALALVAIVVPTDASMALLLVVTIMLPALFIALVLRRSRRRESAGDDDALPPTPVAGALCGECGYPMPPTARCPECGWTTADAIDRRAREEAFLQRFDRVAILALGALTLVVGGGILILLAVR